uniref:Glutathione S-transferase 1 n=1 Tax=Elaeophora elaphi TaxID=1147741 RepID=A0A0R3RTD2_9BILA
LTYFNGRGRAEVIRLLFAQANVSYDDIRINKSDWPAIKPKTPYGHVPILNVSGKILAESHAIERYLARKFDLLGGNEWEAAKIDEIICNLEDVWLKMLPWIHEENSSKKDEMFDKLVKKTATPFLEQYEKFLVNSHGPYFIGNKISLADLAVFNMLNYFSKLTPKYPKLNEFATKIGQMPKIKAWIDKRPDTNF